MSDNGYFSEEFQAYLVPDLAGSLSMIDTMPVVEADRYGIDPAVQHSGFPYLFWESDVAYPTKAGKIQLPLSTWRKHPNGPSGTIPSYSPYKQTSVVVKLHEPMAQRIIKIKAVREGDWPKVPFPKEVHQDKDGYYETLLKMTLINDTPRLAKDNTTQIYSVQIQWTYALSRDPGSARASESSPNTSDTYRAASSPIDKTTPASNRFSIATYFDKMGTIDDVLAHV